MFVLLVPTLSKKRIKSSMNERFNQWKTYEDIMFLDTQTFETFRKHCFQNNFSIFTPLYSYAKLSIQL
jgi:hypothetical protein